MTEPRFDGRQGMLYRLCVETPRRDAKQLPLAPGAYYGTVPGWGLHRPHLVLISRCSDNHDDVWLLTL